MKRCCTAIALCVLVAGCDKTAPRSFVGPDTGPRKDTPTSFYTLTGHVEDADGKRLSGATVRVSGADSTQTTVSDEQGQYRFERLMRGPVVIRVSKADFLDTDTPIFIAVDLTLTFRLQRLLLLTVDTPLKGVVQGPPCDPDWDARAPCQYIHLTPPETGLYELVLTWNGSSQLDMLIDGSLYFNAWPSIGELHASVPGQAGIRREIRIQSYYASQPFELTASLLTP